MPWQCYIYITNTGIIPLIFRTNNRKRHVAREGLVWMSREFKGERNKDFIQNILILRPEKCNNYWAKYKEIQERVIL
jgi:hypothetical protein